MKKFKGYAVVWVNEDNEIEPSHSDSSGWYQEIFEDLMQARWREQELLHNTGGVFEIVLCTMEFTRDVEDTYEQG